MGLTANYYLCLSYVAHFWVVALEFYMHTYTCIKVQGCYVGLCMYKYIKLVIRKLTKVALNTIHLLFGQLMRLFQLAVKFLFECITSSDTETITLA